MRLYALVAWISALLVLVGASGMAACLLGWTEDTTFALAGSALMLIGAMGLVIAMLLHTMKDTRR